MAKDNKNIKFKGNAITVTGSSLSVGSKAPNFRLTGQDLSDLTLANYSGKTLIILVVPSLDTPVCANETKEFNKQANKLGDNVEILVVSMDLPFAQKRWCGAEDITRVKTASDYKYREFGQNYGTFIPDLGIHCRAIFIVAPNGTLKYVDYISEISAEPNYQEVLSSI